MGLDDFMDLDVDEDESSQTTSSSDDDENPLEAHDNWRKDDSSEWERYGHNSFEYTQEYEDTIAGQVDITKGLLKYRLPVFPHIQPVPDSQKGERKFEHLSRYRQEGNIKKFVCFSHGTVALGNIPREIIMLDTGHAEKEDCMKAIEKKIDVKPTPSTEVELVMVANSTHLIKLAIADSLVDSWKAMADVETAKAILMEDNANTVVGDKTDEEHVGNEYHIEPW
jgi:hypothetical protein